MDKIVLRRQVAALSADLSAAYREDASAAIARHILDSPLFRESGSVFVYISTPREVQTRALIEAAWEQGKAVYAPKCGAGRRMDAIRIRSWADLTPGRYGIMEPVGDETASSPPELALIPCVSASKSGARLGHGGGYYDVFLAENASLKLCLCFEKLLREDIPMEKQDIWMDYVATESGLWRCEKT